MMDRVVTMLVISLISITGATPIQVVPDGIESVNGSNVNVGCTSPLVDSGGVMVCESISHLVDGYSPDIDTNTSDWASQLVTVRKNDSTAGAGFQFSHVLLTFGFPTNVSLIGVELDLFLCSEWNIGASYIYVYGDDNSDLVLQSPESTNFFASKSVSETSCDSLTTVSISPTQYHVRDFHHTWHIVVEQKDVEWLHVGEVRLLGIPEPSTCISTPSSSIDSVHYSSVGRVSLISTSTPSTTSTGSLNMYITTIKSTIVVNNSIGYLSLVSTPTRASSGSLNMYMTTRKSMKSTTIVSYASLSISLINPSSSKLSLNPSSNNLSQSGTSIHSPRSQLSSVLPSGATMSPSTNNQLSSVSPSTNPMNTLGITSGSVRSSTTHIGSMLTSYIHSSVNNNYMHTNNGTTEASQYIVIAASIALVLFITVIGLFVTRMHYLSRRHHKQVQNRDKNATAEQHEPYYPQRTPTLNPAYYHCDNPVSDGLYREVVIDKVYTPVMDSTGTKIATAHGEEFIGAYDVIKSNCEIIESAAYACVQLETIPTVAEEPVLQNDPEEGQLFSKEEESVTPVQLYSVVQVREAPAVPTKSSDLEQYLDTQSALNKGMYSEAISPSDFTHNKVMGDVSDPQILGPVYVLSSMLHEADQQPAEVTRDYITDQVKELGIGQFGEVVLADTNDLSLKEMWSSKTNDVSLTVAVKKLSFHPSQKQQEAFNMEVKFLSQLEHPNVLHLLGVCYNYPVFIIMEYTEIGNLNQFLQRYTEIITTPTSDTQIATSSLLYMAAQIADAMQYLAAFNFIHRDIATRTCLVGMYNSIKVGNLGVNKKLYQSHYYCIRGNKLLPVRWMSTECFSGKFSEKSDVWAFGVTMWEIFTLAKDLPYPHLSDDEVIHNALKREYRLFPSRSAACPEPVYEIMEQCWIVNLKQRPTFEKLHSMLLVHL